MSHVGAVSGFEDYLDVTIVINRRVGDIQVRSNTGYRLAVVHLSGFIANLRSKKGSAGPIPTMR